MFAICCWIAQGEADAGAVGVSGVRNVGRPLPAFLRRSSSATAAATNSNNVVLSMIVNSSVVLLLVAPVAVPFC